MSDPKPPRHLSSEAKRLWRSIVNDYQLEDRHKVLLTLACEALDRLREAQATITAEGAYIEGRYGRKSHPAIAVERDSRLAFARLARELGLDLSDAPTARMPTRWRP